MRPADPLRRLLLGSLALPLLQGCAAPLAPLDGLAAAPDAAALLAASAAAHGMAALAGIHDISVAYEGAWRGLVGRLQPDLVDAAFRGRSQERWLLPQRLLAQAHTGPGGRKQVVRRMGVGGPGSVRVWYNGTAEPDGPRRDAAALVADGYSLFLLGPTLLAGPWTTDRSLILALAAPERIKVGGRSHACDVLRVQLAPGLGLSVRDQLALYIDRDERLMRRVRFTLDGLAGTRGALAEVDSWGHIERGGLRWPTRFHERLLRPLPIPVHDWQLTGLDLNRGMTATDIDGPTLAGTAADPARAL